MINGIYLIIGLIIVILLLNNLRKDNEFSAKYELKEEDIVKFSNVDFDYIIDTREIYDYKKSNIDKTYHIPLSIIKDGKKLNEFQSLRNINFDSKILIFSDKGNNARYFANLIYNQGYHNFYYINMLFEDFQDIYKKK